MDRFTKSQRSRCMSHIKGKNTSLEKVFRKAVSTLKIRGYRLHARITGRPDLYFPASRIAVFVDGCFWHGCPRCYSLPASHKAFWTDKVNKNRKRDRVVNAELRKAGIRVVRFWGHQIKKNPQQCAQKLQRIIQK